MKKRKSILKQTKLSLSKRWSSRPKWSSKRDKKNPAWRKWLRRSLLVVTYLAAFIVTLMFLTWLIFGRGQLTSPDDIKWGVTYSPLAAEDLGLDPDTVLDAVVNDLKPDKIRLVAYWNRLEYSQDNFDFSSLDRQVATVEAAGIPYIITVGRRVPRYPECHEPEWLLALPADEQQTELLEFIEETINRYDSNPNLSTWQIENEPYLSSFGICPNISEQTLEEEFALAGRLTSKQIMTTDSGELSFWIKASNHPDILGTTLYRTVIVNGTDITVTHIYPSWWYRVRANISKLINKELDDVVIAELQGEPWTTKGIVNSSQAELDRTMDVSQFEENIKFSERVGFSEVYWWGVEWWYYEKIDGNTYFWERAKDLMN